MGESLLILLFADGASEKDWILRGEKSKMRSRLTPRGGQAMNRLPTKHSHLRIGVILIILSLSCQDQGHRSATPAVPLESYIEAELLRLEETYRILDRYGEELWPGWMNYANIPVKANFPNGVILLVTPPSRTQPGFERIAGRVIFGKSVFVNRRNQASAEVRPPLFPQRARGGALIELDMGQPDLPPLEAERSAALEARLKDESRPENPFNFAPLGDSDSHILMYVHEHFHGHQKLFSQFQGALPVDAALRGFKVNARYAAWSRIEGLALRRAYVESQDAAALDFLKDFMVAREIKHAYMPPGAGTAEARISLIEGTPSYVSIKTAMLLRDSGDKPGLDRSKDPFFYNYAYINGYIDNIMRKGMNFAVSWTEDKQGKYYLYGAYQCFLLDRFAPGWKLGFLESQKNLDSAMAELLKISEGEKEAIKQRLSTRYSYDEFLAPHDNDLKKKKNR
jgi:hypothetical protein